MISIFFHKTLLIQGATQLIESNCLKKRINVTRPIQSSVLGRQGQNRRIEFYTKYKASSLIYNFHSFLQEMSITISNCDQICHDPLNTSTAKMLYSFPKENRFAKRKQILCDKFYNIPSPNHLRTTSFGFGDKYDFTRDASCSPPPNTYTMEDSFLKNTKKGFGFGKGRDQMEVTGPFVAAKKNKNPGPDTYALPSMLDKKSFGFRSKLNTSEQSKRNVPGPGTYPVTFTINQKGKYFLAKYKTVWARDFSKYTGRCQTSQQKVPGPGSYSVQGIDLSPKGKYVSSRLHNCLVGSFEGSQRKFFNDRTNTPGPGNYRLPSEFGYYQSGKKLTKTIEKLNGSIMKGKDSKTSFEAKQNVEKKGVKKLTTAIKEANEHLKAEDKENQQLTQPELIEEKAPQS